MAKIHRKGIIREESTFPTGPVLCGAHWLDGEGDVGKLQRRAALWLLPC